YVNETKRKYSCVCAFITGMAESQILGKDWLINVPSRIPVLESSCVVIPCVYSCPKKRKTFNRFRAFWYRGHTIVASNFPELRLTREFHHRTRMAGSIESGNCTWQLYFVRKTDTGPKTCLNNYLTSDFVKIVDCTEVPKRPVMTIDVRNKVTATCKVTHVCPTSPPHISWSRAGTWTTMSKQENKWLWSTTSTMTFIPRVADFNKRLECKVTFHGRKTTKGSVLLMHNVTPAFTVASILCALWCGKYGSLSTELTNDIVLQCFCCQINIFTSGRVPYKGNVDKIHILKHELFTTNQNMIVFPLSKIEIMT
uniref:Ig-like domain-containing protein n=1 Tax=Poecilia latipinna TaxID=48699 RepID=A0A3B3UY24_9TELE